MSKAFRIIVTRDITESVALTVPRSTKGEALALIDKISLIAAIDQFAQKDGYGNTAWEPDDVPASAELYLGDPDAADEIELCDKCGEELMNDIAAPLS